MLKTKNDKTVTATLFTVAFIAYSISTWVLTNKVFPLTIPVYPFAKDISTTVQALMFLVVAFAALYKPKLLVKGLFTYISALCLSAGTIAVYFGVVQGLAFLSIIGLCLTFTGQVASLVLLGSALLELDTARIGICVLVGLLVAYLLRYPLSYVSGIAGLILYALLQIAVIVMLRNMTENTLTKAHQDEAPAKVALTNPFSFLPLNHPAFICLLLFQIAYGYALTFGETPYSPLLSVAGAIPLLAFFIYYLIRKRTIAVDMLFSIALLFVVAGYMFVPAAELLGYSLASNILEASNACYTLLFWSVLGALAKKNPRGTLGLFAWNGFLLCVGVLIGALLGRVANVMVPGLTGTAIVFTCILVIAYLAYSMVYLGYKKFTFSNTISGLEISPHVIPVPVDNANDTSTNEASIEDVVDTIAANHGLTPRETEVFALLARGRTGTFIQQELVVSYNTVKTHVAHIYDKLGIHNHQELIDYVDAQRKNASKDRVV